jgi:ADP-ribose pyrophosphatase YjhB (NUDIX family)
MTARHRLRLVGYKVFYAMPPAVRRRLVRLAVQKYIVGSVVLLHDSEAGRPGRLLLLRQPSYVGWSLPAGLLKRGETPADGAVRELREETGVVLTPDQVTPAVPSAVVHQKGAWVDMVFTASVPASTTELVVDGAEVIAAEWHSLANLPPLTVATARLLAYFNIGPYADYPEVRGL